MGTDAQLAPVLPVERELLDWRVVSRRESPSKTYIIPSHEQLGAELGIMAESQQ